MREIVVNGRMLRRRVTGVERYGRELLRFIGDCCRVEEPRRGMNGSMGHAWEQFILPGKLNADSVLWSPANTGPLSVREQILTIHDLSPLEHPEWFQPSFAAWYRIFLPRLARRVRGIIVPSQYVQGKVLGQFSVPAEKVRVVEGGVDPSKFHPMDVSNGMGRYILFVGSLEPRKNLPALLKAWGEMREQHADISLVIAGTSGAAFRRWAEPAAEKQVQWMGYVPEEDLAALYAGAELFVLPSFDEGFGLTALEAMACGTPVVVSDGGALPEVAGEAAMRFSLSKPADLTHALQEVLTDEGLRESLRERGLERARAFSWQAKAELLWKNLHEI